MAAGKLLTVENLEPRRAKPEPTAHVIFEIAGPYGAS